MDRCERCDIWAAFPWRRLAVIPTEFAEAELCSWCVLDEPEGAAVLYPAISHMMPDSWPVASHAHSLRNGLPEFLRLHPTEELRRNPHRESATWKKLIEQGPWEALMDDDQTRTDVFSEAAAKVLLPHPGRGAKHDFIIRSKGWGEFAKQWNITDPVMSERAQQIWMVRLQHLPRSLRKTIRRNSGWFSWMLQSATFDFNLFGGFQYLHECGLAPAEAWFTSPLADAHDFNTRVAASNSYLFTETGQGWLAEHHPELVGMPAEWVLTAIHGPVQGKNAA